MDKHYIEIDDWLYILTKEAYRKWLNECIEAGGMVEFPDTVIKVPHHHYHHMWEDYDDFEALLENVGDEDNGTDTNCELCGGSGDIGDSFNVEPCPKCK
jgi:hypothetical protein